MDDLISREMAIDAVRNYPDDLISQLTAIEDLPSAEPEPKTGEWREHIFDGFMGCRPRALRCTRCNYISLSAYNFCPWCGADMRQRSDDNEID